MAKIETRGLDVLQLLDEAADPVVAGELQRNGADLKFHDGVAPRTLLHNGDATKYVVRDATSWDRTLLNGDFITDGSTYVDGLDLSDILPEGTIAVDLFIAVSDENADSDLTLRRSATYFMNRIKQKVIVGGQENYQVQRIAVDPNRKLDYSATSQEWTAIALVVVGWVI